MEKSDYTDPICPFDLSMWSKDASESIPVQRILKKEDDLLAGNDYDGAIRLVQYWISEAEACRDVRGAFTLENELMGLFRKTGKRDEAFLHGEKAVALSRHEAIGEGSVSGATAFLNLATVCKAFKEPERAAELYEKARTIYEKELDPGDGRLGGLYNNYALALNDVGRYDDAITYFTKALKVMEHVPAGKLEMGMTYLNLADTTMNRDARFLDDEGNVVSESTKGAHLTISPETEETVETYLDLAWDALNDPAIPANGYYAYVIETCAPAFEDYGRENEATALRRMAEEIRETYEGA